MEASFIQVLVSLLAGIAVIIVFVTRLKVPAFFSILLACFVTGLGIGMPMPAIIDAAKSGFGDTMRSLGFIVVLGATLGVLLEETGATQVMANYILRKTGEKRASLAIAITGFIVGLPVFCDSGYIVLSGLNKSMIRRSGLPVVVMSLSLAAGLYSVHCLLPPHPGATAAAVTLGVEFGTVILYGIGISFISMLLGHVWARRAGKHHTLVEVDEVMEAPAVSHTQSPSVAAAFLPVIVPLILISLRSIFYNTEIGWVKNLLVIGDPVIALAIAVLLALLAKKTWSRQTLSSLLQNAIEKSGSILLIIGAGGAFGAILTQARLGEHFSSFTALGGIGLFFPFLLAFVLKTAQGSSTVAIMTAAVIVLPLLPWLGLDSDNGRMLAVLALGAGSMMVSHANDAYFWVISQFSGIELKTMLRTYTVMSIIMGVSSMLLVWLLGLMML